MLNQTLLQPAGTDQNVTTPAALRLTVVPKAELVTRDQVSSISIPKQAVVKVHGYEVIRSKGKAYIVIREGGNPYVIPVSRTALGPKIREDYRNTTGQRLNKRELEEILEDLKGHAEQSNVEVATFSRVAPVPGGGVIIDIGDRSRQQVKITPGKVERIASGSDVLFYRTSLSLPMTIPDTDCQDDAMLISKYLNLKGMGLNLLLGWLTYTLAHPKVEGTDFVFLTILGGQGSGKSLMSKICKSLIDPDVAGIGSMPNNEQGLAVVTEHSHVACFDNMRHLSRAMSDALCRVSTSASHSARKLYTDGDQYAISLHSAAIFNGISAFIDQPDLAQRCLTFSLGSLHADQRVSREEMQRGLAVDLPLIQWGLFVKISKILQFYPTILAKRNERMMDFCKWLAAMEIVDGAGVGTYQDEYSAMLNQGQLDTLLDNPLASALLTFAELLPEPDFSLHREWVGTPTELLMQLDPYHEYSGRRAHDWPSNPISLSKRLPALIPALESQGIRLEVGARGKERKIILVNFNSAPTVTAAPAF